MINNANKYTVGDIFGPDNKVRYVIPKFQREYTWSTENWGELLNDILEADGNHFIGSIIGIRQEESDILGIQELEIIDGQQRLTTISLLYATIYKLLKEKNTSDNEELAADLVNLKYRLIQKQKLLFMYIALSQQKEVICTIKFYKAVFIFPKN